MKIRLFNQKNGGLKIVASLKDFEPSLLEALENRVIEKIADRIVEEKYEEIAEHISIEELLKIYVSKKLERI